MFADGLPRPFLKCAVLCERVLVEKDGVLSVIRVFDRVAVEVFRSDDGSAPRAPIEGYLLVAFIRGQSAPSHTVGLVITSPSGRTLGQPQVYPLDFADAEEATAYLRIQLKLAVEEDGMHWFRLTLDNERVTDVPLRVAITLRETRT